MFEYGGHDMEEDLFQNLNPEQRAATAEAQVQELQKITDYEIREWPIGVLVDKFTSGLDNDSSELFIPGYQREMVWTPKQQSRFIESILIRLPVPFIFAADVGEGDRVGSLEIVDGSQRIRTLDNFLSDKLTLVGLRRLTSANGMKFSQFAQARRLRFKRQTIRVIEMTDKADEDARREMFDRLNSGGTKLKSMEIRRGAHSGPYTDFISACAELSLFKDIVVPSDRNAKHKEHEEMALRYFAYVDKYQSFHKSVEDFLTDHLKEGNTGFGETKLNQSKEEFIRMLSFIQANIPNGFKRPGHKTVPRIRFEALAVGATLALRENPALIPVNVEKWLSSAEFMKHTRSDASNSRPKLVNRIHFVRDNLLGRPVEYDKKTEEVENSANADAPEDEQEDLFDLA
jgi:hypothetical protein